MGLAVRPGRGVPAVHDDSPEQRTAGIREGAADRSPVPRLQSASTHGISVVVAGARVESQAPVAEPTGRGPKYAHEGRFHANPLTGGEKNREKRDS